MKRAFGIETEYGITVDGAESIDVVHESIEIVRSYTAQGASMKWNYKGEDPHQDARGHRAASLLQDSDEAAFYEIDKQRPLSFEEIKSDLVLSNGARFYNDHAHPEYSTPECTTLREIVAQDKAGELILEECARRRNAHLPDGQHVRLYKNNTDFNGHSYGCHDNYLMRRDVPWGRLVEGMLPFLVTRQIFSGAGKLGVESENNLAQPGLYQISQRSDFLAVLVSIDTMNQRPIINTRDEPHADASLYRRFHVIVGDANMSEFATALKIGTTALVLDLIEQGKAPLLTLADPVNAAKAISRDQDYHWILELEDGRKISAVDVQRLYLAAASRSCGGDDEETRWLLGEWERMLDDLAEDFTRCQSRVDWVAKKFLLQAFRESEQLEWTDPWLQALDLEYHFVDSERGLYHEMRRANQMLRLVSDEEIAHAVLHPPSTTRAYFRGRSVARFGREIASIQWNEVVFRRGSRLHPVSLEHIPVDARLTRLNGLVDSATDLTSLLDGV